MNIIALCTDLSGDKTPPEWVELLPAGPEIEGRDGRSWTLKIHKALNRRFRVAECHLWSIMNTLQK